MATRTRNTHRRSSRHQRNRRIAKVVAESWLLVLVSHTLATLALLVAERLFNVPAR